MTGPRLLTFDQVAAEISKAADRKIRYIPASSEQYASLLREQGLSEDLVNPLVELITTVLDGRNVSLSDGVQRALGRAPRDFAEYARETAASGVWAPTSVGSAQ